VAVAAALVGGLLGTASGAAATTSVGGYAYVTGHEAGSWVPVAGYLSNDQTPQVRRVATGQFLVFFPGVADQLGLLQVRALSGGVCQLDPVRIQVPVGMVGEVAAVGCFDASRAPTDLPFMALITEGSWAAGLSAAEFELTTVDGWTSPLRSYSTSPGNALAHRTGVGTYTFFLPALAGPAPKTIAITAESKSATVCGVTGNGVSGMLEEIHVRCRAFGGLGNLVDTGVSLTYTRAINLIGVTDLNTAYAFVSKSVAASRVIPADRSYDQASGYGTNGQIAVIRSAPGKYEVRLDNQLSGSDPAASVATVTSTGGVASCTAAPLAGTPGTSYQRERVRCRSMAGVLVDTGFRIQYSMPG
jgi:hypothetical protein